MLLVQMKSNYNTKMFSCAAEDANSWTKSICNNFPV